VTQPFLGQIQCFGFGFAPVGWALCQGQLLPISQNTALFALLGTYYGGNGTSTFQLPDLQSRVPVGQGQLAGGETYYLGEQGGVENVTLNLGQMAQHNHTFNGITGAANSEEPFSGVVLATSNRRGGVSPGDNFYAPPDASTIAININSLSMIGNTLPHTNIQPYLGLNWCIALRGIFPPRN
jgi:microcystin-dependent protein